MDTIHSREASHLNTSAKDIVMGYQRALGSSDWEAARRHLRDDMSFKGPLAAYDKPEPYLEDLKKLHHIVKGVDMKKVFVDGNDVCLIYDMITNTPAGTAYISELYHIEGGKIASVRVVFDPRPFAAMWERK
jgi:SnoaL-like protein